MFLAHMDIVIPLDDIKILLGTGAVLLEVATTLEQRTTEDCWQNVFDLQQ